jgi:hypothetical protein
MEDSDYTCIPVRLHMQTFFWGLHHYIWVCNWLYGVAIMSNIIHCVVYLQSLAVKYFFACYEDCVPLCICELAISVALVFSIKEMS